LRRFAQVRGAVGSSVLRVQERVGHCSLVLRYRTHDEYMAAVNRAVDVVVGNGFMLERDARTILESAAAERNRWVE
jgi:hypothetical protein